MLLLRSLWPSIREYVTICIYTSVALFQWVRLIEDVNG